MKNRINIDNIIVRQVCRGDSRAFKKLVEGLMKPAYYHALALLGNHDDAIDVSQQAFIRTWNARSSIDPERPFYPWFYTILKRLCLNSNRDKNRGREIALSMMPPWIEPVSGDDASDDIMQAEQSRLIQDALSKLSMDDREIIIMKDLDGFSYKEIAELLDIPVGTVMSRLYTARKRLKTKLEEAGYEHT
jgi:RNA polymerase sigma-70 factor, ECF subfamily